MKQTQAHSTASDVWLEDFQVKISSREVYHQSNRYRLTPKSLGVLCLLLENAGEVVTHQQFMERVWQDCYRSNDVLAHSIRELRKIFLDDPQQPKFIETIPKQGYRLIAKVATDNEYQTSKRSLVDKFKMFGNHNDTKGRTGLFIRSLAVATVLISLFWGGQYDYQPLSLSDTTQLPSKAYQSIPLTSALGFEIQPSFSADGHQMVYSAQSENNDQYDLYVKNLVTQQVTQLTQTDSTNEYSAVWSPDGTQIAYLAFSEHNCQLLLVSLFNGEPRQLSYCANAHVTSLDWSPDGTQIAFSYAQEGGPGNVGLHYFDLIDGRVKSYLIPMTEAFSDHSPRFSKDGKSLAFIRSSSSSSNLHLFELPKDERDGSIDQGVDNKSSLSTTKAFEKGTNEPQTIHQLTHYNGHINGLDWLNNDRQLVFSAPTKNARKLHRITIETGIIEQFSHLDASFLTSQPMTDHLAYVDYKIETRMQRFVNGDSSDKHLQQDGAEYLFSSTRPDVFPAVSPNGEQLAFISSRTGKPELWMGNLLKGDIYQASINVGNQLLHPNWSPDSRYVVFVESFENYGDLIIYDTQSQQQNRLTDLGNVKYGSFSLDGNYLLFATEENHRWSNFSFNLTSKQIVKIFDDGGVNPSDPLGDGHLYFTKSGVAGLWKKSMSSGAEELITRDIGFWNHASWDMNSSGIYYAGLCDESLQPSICKLDLSNHLAQSVTSVTDLESVKTLSVDSLSQSIIIGTVRNTASDIMLLAHSESLSY